MNLIIVDDNKAFREGLAIFVEQELGHKVIATFEDGKLFLENVKKYTSDIIIMDIEMPKLNGIEATKLILWEKDYLKVIAVTNYQSKAYLRELLLAGFKACVYKNNVFKELGKAINKVNNGDLYFSSELKFKIDDKGLYIN